MGHLETLKIRKNSKKLPAIWEKGTNCQVFTLDNGFKGQAVELRHAKEAFERLDGSLVWEGDRQRYSVHIHSRLFYYFDGPDPAEL